MLIGFDIPRPGSQFPAWPMTARTRGGCFLAFLTLALSGCTAQFAHRDAQVMIENNQVEAGLTLYQKALRQDPNNIELRMGYTNSREWALKSFLDKAERAIETGQLVEAETLFRRALTIDARNDRARNGLVVVDREQRHGQLLRAAAADIKKGDIDLAKAKLMRILAEDPKSVGAKTLMSSIEVKEEPRQPESLLAATYKKPISIDFKDAQLKQVFEVISMSSGLNFLFDKDVKLDQKTSIFLKNSTIEAAVYYMLLTNQLDQQIMDEHTVLIYPNNAGKQKEYQQLTVKKFLLANANAKAISEALKSMMKVRDVVVDEKLNMIIVRDSPEAVRMAEKLIAMQDIPEPEVMLEVEVLEVSRTRLQELGVQYPGSLSLTPLNSTRGTALTVTDLRNLNSDRIGASLSPFTVNARAGNTNDDILANPRIRVLNREKAKIMIGSRVPLITSAVTATGIISESINYIDVGLKLEVEPTIYLDNEIAIRVGLEVSTLGDQQKSAAGTTSYTIGNRTANTILRLKDGENQVLAGLIQDEDKRTANKIPGLGDIPVVGRLFGTHLTNGSKTEVVLSITPRLIRNNRRPEASAAEFTSGTESNPRRLPDVTRKPSVADTAKRMEAPVRGGVPQ